MQTVWEKADLVLAVFLLPALGITAICRTGSDGVSVAAIDGTSALVALLVSGGFFVIQQIAGRRRAMLADDYLQGKPICWRCLRRAATLDDGRIGCPSCKQTVRPGGLRTRKSLPIDLSQWLRPRVIVKRDHAILYGFLGIVWLAAIVGTLHPGLSPVSAWLILIAAGVVLAGIAHIAVFKRRVRKEIAAGTWRCWVCLYRIDNLPKQAERCPECGAVKDISEYEWRLWLGLGTGTSPRSRTLETTRPANENALD